MVSGVWKQRRRGQGRQKQSCLDYRLSWTNYNRTRNAHTTCIRRSAETQQPCSSSMRVSTQQSHFNICSYVFISKQHTEMLVFTHRGVEQIEETAGGIPNSVRWDQRGEFTARRCWSTGGYCPIAWKVFLLFVFRRWRLQEDSGKSLWSNRRSKRPNCRRKRRRSGGDNRSWTDWVNSCRSSRQKWLWNRQGLKNKKRWSDTLSSDRHFFSYPLSFETG